MIAVNKLGIIAGQGDLPISLAEAARAAGREVFILTFEDEGDAARFNDYQHATVRRAKVGDVLAQLHSAGCRDLVMAGPMARPHMGDLKTDWQGARLAARLFAAARRGDDALLRVLVDFFESHGFHVIGADEIAGELVTPHGLLGQHRPSARDQEDIARAVKVIDALGAVDVGQAAVVANGQVLAVEALEGTDEMLKRCRTLPNRPEGGVLVKMTKRNQERRVDLPTVGVRTVEGCKAAGLNGIALEAGSSLIIDRAAVVQAADAAGLFLCGVTADDAP